MILLTNNPKVQSDTKINCRKEYVNGTYKDVLVAARDRIQNGHKLLSHPLSGSVKPNETPYKSILISKEEADLDLDSVIIIENSIAIHDNFMRNPTKYGHNKQGTALDDFAEIDYSLIIPAITTSHNTK